MPAMTATGGALRGADMLSLATLSPADLAMILDVAVSMKSDPVGLGGLGGAGDALGGRSVVLLFEKDSLRTRCSFEVGVHRLGGHAMYFDHARQRIGQRESVADYARNLERYFTAIVARTYSHDTVAELAEHASIPVINALCDLHHPCQALADLLTLRERFGDLRGVRLAYVGEGNNVTHSLMHGVALAGGTLTVISPPGHGPSSSTLDEAIAIAADTGATIVVTDDPGAVAGHHAIYTDTWFSMGFGIDSDDPKSARARRLSSFAPYRVDERMMANAGPDAIFLHCLPTTRGEEVTAGVIDGPRSAVFDQAENRLHAQMALMACLLADPGRTSNPSTGKGGAEHDR